MEETKITEGRELVLTYYKQKEKARRNWEDGWNEDGGFAPNSSEEKVGEIKGEAGVEENERNSGGKVCKQAARTGR